MDQLRELIEQSLQNQLISIIISNPVHRDGIRKVRLRPVRLAGASRPDTLHFQAEELTRTQAFHKNLSAAEAADYILSLFETGFRAGVIETADGLANILVSKKGTVTIKRKAAAPAAPRPKISLEHNRKKQYILEEGVPVPFLVDLGVMTADGRVIRAKYDKFRQINRFLEYIEDVLPSLPGDRELRILDFGCGKSYLTFAIYYYLNVLKGYSIRITGLDLKEDVIAHCSELAAKYGYDKLEFLCGDIAFYDGCDQVDMVVTLHACDTATDYALAKAVGWKAKVILSVPCCQHELNRQLKNELLSPLLHYGILQERMAALMTDGLRAMLLEAHGYRTQILDFIDMTHTPKNLLIRAVYQGRPADNRAQTDAILKAFHLSPALYRLLDRPGTQAADS